MTGSGKPSIEAGEDPLAGMKLDPYSGEQLYRQLYGWLKGGILSGAWREGDLIPSENQLSDRFSIARTTVRNAMLMLVNEGLVCQVRGKGTMVTHRPVSHSIWNFGSFTDLARAKGKRPVTHVVEHRIEDNILTLVRARGLQSPSKVEWLNLDTSWLSLELYPGIELNDFAEKSLYGVLREEYSRFPIRSEIKLSVVPPSEHLIKFFGTNPAVPAYICATGEVLDRSDALVERTSIIYSPRVDMKFATSWGNLSTNV
ncbi:putative HTH-type transcriptional regulator YurK (plasmid) [Antarctobacter heliothermus]|uniref:Putative HTH-type transcriptional regulator YurK n=1 Tax=Antarctobacter heliothermus TaxID=74033 RepID=A0A222EAH0_9RHOB|nr:GntR family transcriptional regulator [Antarctobacter heliothermus]ASP23205.1 putative HTH-type transcriptional regulator YurK [Antarctobacter heliothermus]